MSYVLGMAVTYTSAGALAALAGGQIQAMFQEPWIITLFAGLFVVLALGMFGLFELQMPTAVQTRLANLANQQKGGNVRRHRGHRRADGADRHHVRGAAAHRRAYRHQPNRRCGAGLGRAVRAEHRDGVAAVDRRRVGRPAPAKSRAVDEHGEGRLRRLMIGMAIWMMERVLPGSVTLVLWAVLVFLTGVFLGALEPLPANPTPARRLAKGIGVLACLYGALDVGRRDARRREAARADSARRVHRGLAGRR